MARPRKDEGGTPVKQRIKQAFWELYLKRPIEQICVKEVCAGAKCNKTTFYYHYACTAQVLDEIERECELTELPNLIVETLAGGTVDMKFVEGFVSKNSDRIEVTRILLGPKGDPSFKRKLEENLTQRWCEAMGIERSRLDSDDQLFLKYSMSGTMSIVALDPAQSFEPLDFRAIFRLASDITLPRVKKMVAKYTS